MFVSLAVGASLLGVHRAPSRAGQRSGIVHALTFNSKEEHEAHLESQGDLPAGFRTGVSGFQFSPQEAPAMNAVMNLTLIVLDRPSTSFAAVFTRNAFCGAPVTVGRRRLAEAPALQAILVNNKISNVCAAGDGVGACEELCAAAADALGLEGGASAVLPSSTGVIGWALPVEAMKGALPAAVGSLERGSALPAARGIMTTDRFAKLRSAEACGGRVVGIAKGAGMIEPNMATMLAYVLTDVDVPREALQGMLSRACDASFNCASVDGDQSTSDTLVCLSSQAAPFGGSPAELADFEAALTQVGVR